VFLCFLDYPFDSRHLRTRHIRHSLFEHLDKLAFILRIHGHDDFLGVLRHIFGLAGFEVPQQI